MRLLIECELRQETAFPMNHQHLLMSQVYGLVSTGDEEYARFLHDEGYAAGNAGKRVKLFCFSGLRCAKRRAAGETLWLGPGPLTWLVSSPVEAFLRHFATGLLAAGVMRVGERELPIAQVQALPAPDFRQETARFTCLTPIVASLPRSDAEGGGTAYLRPRDGRAFSDAVRNNLLYKHRTLYGALPQNERFELTFDAAYLARNPHGGTKKVTIKGIDVIGVQAPFTACGSPELLKLMYACGAGEKNSAGFGMVELVAGRGQER
jgi:CRISPR-associated endoribonuclease Cas6